jgi:5-formaminoimidazole-4-carboxamide-1-(beta)-D-ribofuranosyl 5'-monophosphate synthetase
VSAEYVARALRDYDRRRLTLASVGSHSALEVASGARAAGLRSLVVTARGRELTYTRYFAARSDAPARGCVDEVIELGSFAEILDDDAQRQLLARNVIFVPNRSFEVYLHQEYEYDEIERRMLVPFFGNRYLLRAEERTGGGAGDGADQYALMERAGIRHPEAFASAQDIDRLVMVKAPHAKVSFERAFFLASSPAEYDFTASRLIDEGVLTAEGLAAARIEEYALGPSVNLNFFYSPVLGELELSGTDTRRQTNLEGFRNIPPASFEALRGVPMRLEEAGHIAATILESMLEPAFAMGERFVAAARELSPPGVIGPFALQCVIAAGPPKELVCYDVSLRIPGSPGTRYTPYSAYRWGRDVSVGERIAMEIVMARDTDRLLDVLT